MFTRKAGAVVGYTEGSGFALAKVGATCVCLLVCFVPGSLRGVVARFRG